MRHALIVVGDDHACVCGARGTRAQVLRHVAERERSALEPSLRSRGFPQGVAIDAVPTDGDDFSGGDTKAHYLPNEPRRPAPVTTDAEPAPLPPAPGIFERPRSIAEAFQDMLRIAHRAGVASAATGESFETWYQREVLQ